MPSLKQLVNSKDREVREFARSCAAYFSNALKKQVMPPAQVDKIFREAVVPDSLRDRLYAACKDQESVTALATKLRAHAVNNEKLGRVSTVDMVTRDMEILNINAPVAAAV